jgi:transcriptional regulator with XRE-family HTH domain
MSAAIQGGAPTGRRKTLEGHLRARRADSRDHEVGKRIRTRRLEQRLSQTELASKIGVTFQQVQKYEKGVNRVGAGRLERIASALSVPVGFFFDANKIEGDASVFSHLQSSGSVRIMKAFTRIKSRKARQLLVELAEELADVK